MNAMDSQVQTRIALNHSSSSSSPKKAFDTILPMKSQNGQGLFKSYGTPVIDWMIASSLLSERLVKNLSTQLSQKK